MSDLMTDDDPIQPDSNLLKHARRELRIAGLLDGDEYDQMIAAAVLEIIRLFATQGHSGTSAAMVTELVTRLMRYEPLMPLTYEPDEWFRHEGLNGDGSDIWQNIRDSAVFSVDGGVTHYRVGVGDD